MSTGTRRIAFRVQYDGTAFHGWQRQKEGRTVQQELESILSRLDGNNPVTVIGSGRTDSGVHAHGQVAHADVRTQMNDSDLLYTLGRMAPDDLAVDRLSTVNPDFHARFDAVQRHYTYSIIFNRDPFRARYAWYLPVPPDAERMRGAADLFNGAHDFTSFSKNNPDTRNMICEVRQIELSERENGCTLNISADRFLYGMVRMITASLVDIGIGRQSEDWLKRQLVESVRTDQPTMAPACGLSLVRVDYGFDPFAGECR